ncbi:MAG: type II toxin-antitoxin system VapC family toxin [Parvularculaceae bacterium]
MIECVLDASVPLAMFRREPGAEQARRLLPSAVVSAVNHAEIISKLIEWNPAGSSASDANETPAYAIAEFTAELAYQTGLLRAPTKRLGLSLGDRACLALGLNEKLPVYTMDRRWAELEIGVEIRSLR